MDISKLPKDVQKEIIETAKTFHTTDKSQCTIEHMFKAWHKSVKSIIKLNKDCESYCKEIEFWLTDTNFDRKRLSLLTSNLDCIMFERFVSNKEYVYQLFLKADKFLEEHNINFLEEALIREGYKKL